MSDLTASCMILKGQSVPVQVPPRVSKVRGACRRRQADGGCVGPYVLCFHGGVRHMFRITITVVGVGLESTHGQPAKRLAISPRLQGSRLVIVNREITNMSVATKDLDRSIRSHSPNCIEHGLNSQRIALAVTNDSRSCLY